VTDGGRPTTRGERRAAPLHKPGIDSDEENARRRYDSFRPAYSPNPGGPVPTFCSGETTVEPNRALKVTTTSETRSRLGSNQRGPTHTLCSGPSFPRNSVGTLHTGETSPVWSRPARPVALAPDGYRGGHEPTPPGGTTDGRPSWRAPLPDRDPLSVRRDPRSHAATAAYPFGGSGGS
jgi:hypothetical protein